MSSPTTPGWAGLFRRMRQDDRGIGMILVIGVTAFITVMVATSAIIAVNGLGASRQRTAFEQSLAAAESGTDFALARLQRAWDLSASDYPIPNNVDVAGESSPYCNASPVMLQTFANASDERTWVRAQLASLAANHPECIKTTSSGQYLIFKPQTPLVNGLYPRSGNIYSIGWSPSKANPMSTRMIKTEYVFMPYRPSNAVLTGSNLDISSSTTVTVASGSDPTLAAVHANGTITGVGNPSVSGEVSASGGSTFSSNNFTGNTGGKVTTTPTQSIPYVSAESFYYHAPDNDPASVAAGNWFDLCPDGSVRPYSTGGPCTSGTTLGSGINGSSYNGWSYTSDTHLWTASKDTTNGVYFAYQGDITSGTGNPSFQNLTLVAEAANADNCSSQQYGNITWDRYNIAVPAFHNVFMYADGDIITGSQFYAGSMGPPVVSGMFLAGNQIQLETSSQGAVGSVIAADQCQTTHAPTSNQIKNPAVYYDPNSDAPFTSIVTTTLWAEIPNYG